ncbi:MAG: SDR family NAD(P)-dependent oxidoreductase, partial [Brevundimonas sp.]
MALRAPQVLIWTTKYLLHIGAHFCAFVLAYELRRALPFDWWFQDPEALRVVAWAALFALIGALVEAVFQTERAAWRFASLRDVVALVRNVTISVAMFVVFAFVADRGMQLPRSVIPLAWMLTLILLVSVRLVFRLPRDPEILNQLLPSWWPRKAAGRPALLLFGDMEAADRQIRHMLADPAAAYDPIGIVTPDQHQAGTRLHGVPWLGTLPTWRRGARGTGAATAILFLADPIRELGLSAGRIGELRAAGYQLLRPQVLANLTEDGADARMALREIPFEEFLPRQPLVLDARPVRDLIAGKRVLVTGGGGSIGSEIARQLIQLGCHQLTIIDHSEFQLFQINKELENSEAAKVRAVLADVRDTDRVRQIMSEERPEIVFHAAALKHVSLVEENPVEGVRTNVLGTWNVLSAAAEAGSAQFVLISTDKAAAPSNVMGATKRVAEALLGLAPKGSTRFSSVRFGNVLGSAGSVVPIFRDQIARGGPVTVTHPDVERFFMTIPEAVQLVLHSTALNAAREHAAEAKFVLEMGEPVKIVELARQMIQLSGKA